MDVSRRFILCAGLAVVASGGAIAAVPSSPLPPERVVFGIPRGQIVEVDGPCREPSIVICHPMLGDIVMWPAVLISTGERLVPIDSAPGQEVVNEALGLAQARGMPPVPAENAGRSRW